MTREDLLTKLREQKSWLEGQGVVRVRLFGSYARGEAKANSDVDLLVDLVRPLGLEFFRIEEELGLKLGVRVQMITDAALTNRIIRRGALADAIDA